MRIPGIILPALLLAGCMKQAKVEFVGNSPGIKSGVFIVKTVGDSTLFGENIKDGKFSIPPKHLKQAGYYLMNITDDNNKDDHNPFEVYLEDGQYAIQTEAGKLYKYPKITTSSKTQQELSAFYSMADSLSADAIQNVTTISKELKDNYARLSPDEYNKLLFKQQSYQEKINDVDAAAFKQFLKLYPQSVISTHILSKLKYEDDPVTYNAIFQSLPAAAQNSEDGQQIGQRLTRLVKLVAGKPAPALEGNLANGRPFDPKEIHKKMIVIDFWRAGNELSRTNHDQIKSLLGQPDVSKNVAFISVSLDSKKDWWLTAVKDDKLDWIRISDLKGDDSPNAANYNVTEIPYYYVLDGNWNIVAPNVPIKSISLEIDQYLKKHP